MLLVECILVQRSKRKVVRAFKFPPVTVYTNLSPTSRGRPSSRALKPRLRYKLEHGVVCEVYRRNPSREPVGSARCAREVVGEASVRPPTTMW